MAIQAHDAIMERFCLVRYYADPAGCDRGHRRCYVEVRSGFPRCDRMGQLGAEQSLSVRDRTRWRRYPVKQIISMATGMPVSEFSGAEAAGDANQYIVAHGFPIIEVRIRLGSAMSLFSPSTCTCVLPAIRRGKAVPKWSSRSSTSAITTLAPSREHARLGCRYRRVLRDAEIPDGDPRRAFH